MGEEFGGKLLFSRSVMSNSLWPPRLQHTRLPCPSRGENGYMYMYGWAPSLFTWNYHCLSQLTNSQLFVNWLYELSHFSHIQLFATWWTIPLQAPLSIGFCRQEYWDGLPFPPPEDPPNTVIKPRSPISQADSLPSEPPGMPNWLYSNTNF